MVGVIQTLKAVDRAEEAEARADKLTADLVIEHEKLRRAEERVGELEGELDAANRCQRPHWDKVSDSAHWRVRVEVWRPDGNRLRQDHYVDRVAMETYKTGPKRLLFDETEMMVQNVAHMAVDGPAALSPEPEEKK